MPAKCTPARAMKRKPPRREKLPESPRSSAPRAELRGRGPRRSVEPAQLRAEADVIDARIRRVASATRKNTIALSYDLAEMDQDRRWSAYGFKSLVHYAWDRGVDGSAQQIRQLVAMVRSLERLPKSKRAYRAGVAGWTLFRELARYATPENEEQLLADMLAMSSEQFESRLRLLRGAPDRRKVTIEVTIEERDVILAAAAAVRASDQRLTLGQAVARACKAYVQSTGAGTDPAVDPRPAFTGPPPPAFVDLPVREEAVVEQDVRPLALESAGPSTAVDHHHLSSTSVSSDGQEVARGDVSREVARSGRVVVELDRSGLSVRGVDGTVLGRVSFDRPPAPPVVATPGVVTATNARIRAG